MINYLLKLLLGIGVMALLFLYGSQTTPVAENTEVIYIPDDTPGPKVEVIDIRQPKDRMRVELEPPVAVFSHNVENDEINLKAIELRQNYMEHMTFMLDELRETPVWVIPDDILIEIDRTNISAELQDVISFPTEKELLETYNEEMFLEWNSIRQIIRLIDDFEVRATFALQKGKFPELAFRLEEYQDVLDTRLKNPQKFWSLISEYEITIYLERQQLNTQEDISSDTLYDQITIMTTYAWMTIQKDLWQDSPLLELYLALFN